MKGTLIAGLRTTTVKAYVTCAHEGKETGCQISDSIRYR